MATLLVARAHSVGTLWPKVLPRPVLPRHARLRGAEGRQGPQLRDDDRSARRHRRSPEGTTALRRPPHRWAELRAHATYVISARHGLLDPDQQVAWYDERVAEAVSVHSLAWRVLAALGAPTAPVRYTHPRRRGVRARAPGRPRPRLDRERASQGHASLQPESRVQAPQVSEGEPGTTGGGGMKHPLRTPTGRPSSAGPPRDG